MSMFNVIKKTPYVNIFYNHVESTKIGFTYQIEKIRLNIFFKR